MLYNLFENRDFVSVFAVALLAEGVDRNTPFLKKHRYHQWSPSSQRAWIEIIYAVEARPAAGSPSSQRAWIEIAYKLLRQAAKYVALLAEGVDRNRETAAAWPTEAGSPSSQRAWIEIEKKHLQMTSRWVALLAEGVDRNRSWITVIWTSITSPSSQRAWIEIVRR